MIDYEKTLTDLIKPLVDDEASLRVQTMQSIDGDEDVLLYVYAKSEDIARLIGRQGNMAFSIRQMMSVCGHLENKRVSVKFESY